MSRYVDADALKAVFEEKSSEAVCGVGLCKAIIYRINEVTTVDAVPVIRCKDCQFNYGIENGVEFNPDDIVCTYFETDGMHANDFCSMAERHKIKDGEQLVRCKDCKYYSGKWCKRNAISDFDLNDIVKSADDFCPSAERREE